MYLLPVAGLIACKDASLFEAFSCPWDHIGGVPFWSNNDSNFIIVHLLREPPLTSLRPILTHSPQISSVACFSLHPLFCPEAPPLHPPFSTYLLRCFASFKCQACNHCIRASSASMPIRSYVAWCMPFGFW